MRDLLLGYAITAAVYSSFLLMLVFLLLDRKSVCRTLGEHADRYSLIALAAIVISFVVFSLAYVSPVEQLYFDENIYQAVALNMLKNGNSLWCQFGTGYVSACYVNAIYHDPVGWSAFIAIAFAIFGIGTQTAYGLELAVGALSIIFVFFAASLLSKQKGFPVIAALAMSLMPQLFIWSRTQADLDLPFMMLATLTFLLFLLLIKRKSLYSLGAFASSLELVSYMRIEALLLLPVFIILLLFFGEEGLAKTLRERVALARAAIETNTRALALLLVFVVLLLPEVYYVSTEAQSPSYGQPAGQSVVSLSNFGSNIGTNTQFMLGQFNSVNLYPAVFHYAILPLALLGIAALAIRREQRNRFGVLLLLLLWFLAYFIFYTSFYAGSALYGVDSRFMLQLLPPLCLLAAFAIVGLGEGARFALRKTTREKTEERVDHIAAYAVMAISAIVLLVLPFAQLAPIVTLPTSEMPQQPVILRAVDSFYANYSLVPRDCLVFSFTPDIWFEANRSSAQINYLLAANQSIKGEIASNSCLVFDYGYWCVVPPYHSTTCSYVTSHFKLENLTAPAGPLNGNSVALYRILNYT